MPGSTGYVPGPGIFPKFNCTKDNIGLCIYNTSIGCARSHRIFKRVFPWRFSDLISSRTRQTRVLSYICLDVDFSVSFATDAEAEDAAFLSLGIEV